MQKKILIITYKFPPMGGIGTRRWVKFAKYLSKLGYQVHILTRDYHFIDKTTWSDDVDKNIIIHKFKSYYPSWLLSESSNYFTFQIKRYSNFILKKTLFYLDNAQYDAKNILSNSKGIIEKYQIQNVIATGHPVSINYISSYLKIDNSDINLIQDYRDNWNDLNLYQYGKSGGFCFFKRKEESARKEFFTLFYADKVLNVSEDLTLKLAKKHKSLEDKFLTLTNGYDHDDFNNITSSNTSFNIIYAGSLFNERIEAVYLLLDAIISLNDAYINNNFRVVIYSNYNVGRMDKKYEKLINKNIIFKAFIPPREVLKEISTFSFCLSINSKFASYAFGTKIFDYMALNKSILHVSNRGALFNMIKEKNQFVSEYNLEEMKETLLNMKEYYINNINNAQQENYEEFSIFELTLKLEKLFI